MPAKVQLNIIAAIALRHSGHNVTILENHAVVPEALILRSYKDSNILSTLNLAARDLGVKIQLNPCVIKIDFSAPSVTLKTGATVATDLIIGADGLRSRCREEMMGRAEPPRLTGDLTD